MPSAEDNTIARCSRRKRSRLSALRSTQYLDGNHAIKQRLLAAVNQAKATASDFCNLVEPGVAQFCGDAEDLVLLRCVRLGLGQLTVTVLGVKATHLHW